MMIVILFAVETRMFAKRHPWALTLALAIGAVFSIWLRSSIENFTPYIPIRIILHFFPLLAALLLFYLLVRSIEQEGKQEYDKIRVERIGVSNQLEISTIELGRVRLENESLQAQVRDTNQRVAELESQIPAASAATPPGQAESRSRAGPAMAPLVELEGQTRTHPAITLPVDTLNATWGLSVRVGQDPDYRFDPIYGAIMIDGKLLQVFDQPIVQRLSHIRQLSFSYLTFPTATHSRLAHSLGVCKIADLALTGILARNQLYSAESDSPRPINLDQGHDRLLLRCKIAALLHDLGHGPFGHALDKYVGFHDPASVKVHPDKDYSIRYIRECLSKTLVGIDLTPESITELLDITARRSLRGFDALLADLIDSPLDVDRMDYLFRDGIMTGLTAGYGSLHTLLEMMRPFVSGDAVSLAFDERAVPAIENLLYLRDFMYVNCYEVAAKLAAERAFQRIAEEVVSTGLLTVDQLMLLTDDNVLSALASLGRSNQTVDGLAQGLLTGQRYEEVYSCMPSKSQNKEVKNWVENKLLGDVGGGLRQAYVVLPRLWERRIADRAGIGADGHWQVLVSVPSYFAYVQKESGARILIKGDIGWKTVDLFDYSQKLGAILEQMRPASAYVRVFASLALSPQERDRVRGSAKALLD
jgi:HD superfamily phosphohydrolase